MYGISRSDRSVEIDVNAGGGEGTIVASPVRRIGGRPGSGLAGNESRLEEPALTPILESSCLASDGG